MTREEAREELIEEWNEFIDGCGLRGIEEKEAKRNPDFKKVYEANLMAIQELSQEPIYISELVQKAYEDGKKDGYIQAKIEQEPCEDAISRQAVKDTIYHECSGENLDIEFTKVLLLQRAIKALPPVTPQPKIGHWITTRTFIHDGELYCDKCECDAPNNEKWDYCPNCGAKMIESQERSNKE